ncbi:MAG: hypothetical protein A3E84_01710 [Gammaproteobacteria bacterium RIFCSPHIGHO2_12_FULL_42_13]|nr:MAG: hypothetical protein A3E84_01710 [Gammaproteobacteria bacterium RIFCSPHIGHO2_12_FULL_42_13]
MKKIMQWCLLAILFSPSSVVLAQNKPGIFTFTPGAGYEYFSARRNLQNTVLPNAAISYNFDEKLAIEFLAGMINTNSTAVGQGGVHGTLYLIDGFYRLTPRHLFAPYLLAGIGLTSLKPNGVDSRQQANINAGIGTQLFADKAVALRADIRDLYTFVGSENDVLVNLGVSFLFGA